MLNLTNIYTYTYIHTLCPNLFWKRGLYVLEYNGYCIGIKYRN